MNERGGLGRIFNWKRKAKSTFSQSLKYLNVISYFWIWVIFVAMPPGAMYGFFSSERQQRTCFWPLSFIGNCWTVCMCFVMCYYDERKQKDKRKKRRKRESIFSFLHVSAASAATRKNHHYEREKDRNIHLSDIEPKSLLLRLHSINQSSMRKLWIWRI